MLEKLNSARSAASALVALESLTNSTRPMRRTSSMRWARPGKLRSDFGELVPGQAKAARGGKCRAGVLRVVRAAQGADAFEAGAVLDGAVHDLEKLASFGINPCIHRMVCRNSERPDAARSGALRDGVAKAVIGADNGRLRILEDRLLHGGVVFEAAVPVDVVRRDVEQDRGVGVEARRQVELEAGELDHVMAAIREGRQIEHRLADIAAKHRVDADRGKHVMRERGGGGFAVRAGDGNHLRGGAPRLFARG